MAKELVICTWNAEWPCFPRKPTTILLHTCASLSLWSEGTSTNTGMSVCGVVHVNRNHYKTLLVGTCKVTSGVFCAGSEFTGGGAPLSGADWRKPCVQPPPLLTRQCAKFSSSSLCMVSMTTTAQRCLYMRVHIDGGLCQLFESQRTPHRGKWPLVSSLQQLHGQ